MHTFQIALKFKLEVTKVQQHYLTLGLDLLTSVCRFGSPPARAAMTLLCARLSCMILIDSFIDCKEIGCSYNTAGVLQVMKRGIWP